MGLPRILRHARRAPGDLLTGRYDVDAFARTTAPAATPATGPAAPGPASCQSAMVGRHTRACDNPTGLGARDRHCSGALPRQAAEANQIAGVLAIVGHAQHQAEASRTWTP